MIYIIGTEDILNCIAYPKLDIFITDDKTITAMEKQRRIAPIKPTNAFVKRKHCRNLHLYRR